MRRAFSLLEVVVASALLALVLAVVLAPLARSRTSARRAQGRAGALRLAEDLLIRPVAASGQTSLLGREYVYQVTRSAVEPALTRIEVQVRWPEGELRHLAYVYRGDR